MIQADCTERSTVLQELDRRSPGAPFLALGQTVFWDEPMKAGVILESQRLGHSRSFIAGIHDTDYFAKFRHEKLSHGYRALPHNDTTTKDLWSAAGEFSVLMGSETVVTRDRMLAAGARLGWVQRERPGYLDSATEAWGWRGVVDMGPETHTTSELPLRPMFAELYDTLQWAIDESLHHISGPHLCDSQSAASQLLAMVCEEADSPTNTLTSFYRGLAPKIYNWVAGQQLDPETTTTSELLRFNSETVNLPRFDLLRLFVEPATRREACEAYNQAVSGSEIYPLDRFGTGAVPFDLLIPGVGRGTLRLGNKGGVVMTPNPVGFSIKKPIKTLEDLAEVIEAKFGKECTLVGKAVSLLGMLAREFVFVFHEGASGYVPISRKLHLKLAEQGHNLQLNPILRVKYEPWDAMNHCCAWVSLPTPLQRPFGVTELSAGSFAVQWKVVREEQSKMLKELATFRRPLELIQFLKKSLGGTWQCLAEEYEGTQSRLEQLHIEVKGLQSQKRSLVQEIRTLKSKVDEMQKERGRQWRAEIFEKEASKESQERRNEITTSISNARNEIAKCWASWSRLEDEIKQIVSSEGIQRIKDRRENIALEAELARIQMIRGAVIATDGLTKAAHRPSAWWFQLVCPDGTWFRATMANASYRLEELV